MPDPRLWANVVVTAMVLLASVTPDARAVFEAHLALVMERSVTRWSACRASATGYGDAVAGGIGLPVDAVGVGLQQDGDAVPGALVTSVAGTCLTDLSGQRHPV